MTFLLIVLNLAGGESTFTIDHDLSPSDCAALVEQWEPTLDEYSSVECEGPRG